MHRKLNMWVSCLLLLFLFGCVSKIEFDTVNKVKIRTLGKQLGKLKKEKVKLDNQIETLRKAIQEKETIISIQGKVIKLIDDSNQTLQKSIEAQIAAENIKK